MGNAKEQIEKLLSDIQEGKINPLKAWSLIDALKSQYVSENNQQSWNSFIGHRFEGMIHAIIKAYIARLKAEDAQYNGLNILTEAEIKANEILKRKMVVKYGGDFYLLPDIDSAIVWLEKKEPWKSEVLSIISCKTSLRERIAQSCYWKLKLLSSDVTKGIKIYLATTDNDDDFIIKTDGERYNGKSRDRIISEHEIDGVYILKENFGKDCESEVVKRFEKIFQDIVALIKEK